MNIEYYDNMKIATYNGYMFRKDNKTGYYLSTRKIGAKRKRLHYFVYESEKGEEIPKGYVVHHKDFNKANNSIDNLMLLSLSEHTRLHGKSMDDEQKRKRKENLIAYAMPKAKEWHSTEEGKKWHSQHAKEVYKNLPLIKYKCSYCGKNYETKNRYGKNSNTFCSNKCKSAYRRATGIDNIRVECGHCGKTFIRNKYQKQKYCEEHRNKKDRV